MDNLIKVLEFFSSKKDNNVIKSAKDIPPGFDKNEFADGFNQAKARHFINYVNPINIEENAEYGGYNINVSGREFLKENKVK